MYQKCGLHVTSVPSILCQRNQKQQSVSKLFLYAVGDFLFHLYFRSKSAVPAIPCPLLISESIVPLFLILKPCSPTFNCKVHKGNKTVMIAFELGIQ